MESDGQGAPKGFRSDTRCTHPFLIRAPPQHPTKVRPLLVAGGTPRTDRKHG